jgi:hypothetical protein
MKKTIASLAVLLIFSIGIVSSGMGRHVNATLEPIDGSEVSGSVQLAQLPRGKGSVLHVRVTGLEPGEEYSSFYYERSDCSAPADLFETFTADGNGNANLTGKIDEDVGEVGSVSVRLGPDYGTLLACAAMHEE